MRSLLTARCLHCDGQATVAAGAVTATCPNCGRLIRTDSADSDPVPGPETARMPPAADPIDQIARDVRIIRRNFTVLCVLAVITFLGGCAVVTRGCLDSADRRATSTYR